MSPRALYFIALLLALVALSACGEASSDGSAPESVSLGQNVNPDNVAAAPGGAVWATFDHEVARIGPRGDRLTTRPQQLTGMDDYVRIHDLAAGDAGVWAIGWDLGSAAFLLPVDDRTGRVGKPVRAEFDADLESTEELHVASGAGRVFAGADDGDQLTMLQPATGRQTAILTENLVDVAAGGGYGWAINGLAPGTTEYDTPATLERVAPETGRSEEFELTGEPKAMAFGAGSVWILLEDEVQRYGTDGKLQATVEIRDLGAAAGDIAVAGDAVWAVSFNDGKLARIDAGSNKLSGDLADVRSPIDLTATSEAAWIAVLDAPPLRVAR